MKSLVLCACVLVLAFQPSSSTKLKQKLKNEIDNLRDNIEICVFEQGLSPSDIYREEEIMTNVHTESVNAEKSRKFGCFVACVLKKLNLMDGATIKEIQIHAKINKTVDHNMQDVAHKIARKCLKKARSITQECEKCFSLYVCIIENMHKLEGHEEHV
ncbi:uncharacterized protein LOC105202825 [Solenopsis invicta]|uniref:uncharacterized protein LOC105202825 n=1 Tax=Solenopsis invicta TaxID=13686 RepID=UPI000595F2EC|nr:uncharacterized protein LOC105202825 [Solenopsis invicta]